MPTDFKNIKTTRNRKYDASRVSRLNDSLQYIPAKQRASILGSIVEESGGDPMAKSENGTYQGLLQRGADRYRIKLNDPEAEFANQIQYLKNTINDTTDHVSWTNGGSGSGYNSFRDAYKDFNDPEADLDKLYRGFSYGYVRPAGKEESYNNRLKVVKQIYDIINKAPSKPIVNTEKRLPKIIHTEQPDAIRNYRPSTVSSNSNNNIKKAIQDKVAYDAFMNSISVQNSLPPAYKSQFNAHSDGGFISYPDWNKLSMKDRADVMRIFLDKGISDLDTIRKEYNTFAEGGKIHINPSKKGTFTAAASKHGMGVQEFASKVLANKENYSPAMVKKANFARNASKWHGLGGLLEI